MIAAIAAIALTAAAPPPAKPALSDLLTANRHALTVGAGGLGGEGADILRKAVADARIVAVGEDHLTREVPQFTAALCDEMGAQLSAIVVESGPVATAEVARALRSPDRIARMAKFNARYPNAIAFYDTRADNDFAAHCAKVSRSPAFQMVGIDQEFLGAGGLLIEKILATPLSPAARKAVLALQAADRAGSAAAQSDGNPGALLLLSDSAARLAAVRDIVDRGGNAEARRLVAALVESQAIYAKDSAGAADSNYVRALMMKRQFAAGAPARGKILLKFGDWHLYKGVNPLGERDLGNYVAEISDAAGRPSLHILMLGAAGTHASFAGYNRPLGRAPFKMVEDKDYHWLQGAIDAGTGEGWTLFDLRPLRHRGITNLDPDWKRVIDGYDLMVLVPEITPSDVIRG